MSPRKIVRGLKLVVFLAVLQPLMLLSLPEPQGLIVYRQPSTTFTEVFEYQTFRHDNVLYATLVTPTGDRKQLKAGGVLAVLPYPPPSFDADFAQTAQTAIAKINALARPHPSVQSQLEKARGKWSKALRVFEQRAPVPVGDRLLTFRLGGNILQDVRLTSANSRAVTLTHASGVRTVPIVELSPVQVLELNRHSSAIQLPLGMEGGARSSGLVPAENGVTARVGAVGRNVANFCATAIGVESAHFTIWVFYVVLPGLILLLLLGLILGLTRKRSGINPSPGKR